MEDGQKDFRYSDRARSFDESLEASLSSFQAPQETGIEEKVAMPALERVLRTAGDEVSEIALTPADSNKIAAELKAYEIKGKLRKMAAARPEFIDGFLKESEEYKMKEKDYKDRAFMASENGQAGARLGGTLGAAFAIPGARGLLRNNAMESRAQVAKNLLKHVGKKTGRGILVGGSIGAAAGALQAHEFNKHPNKVKPYATAMNAAEQAYDKKRNS